MAYNGQVYGPWLCMAYTRSCTQAFFVFWPLVIGGQHGWTCNPTGTTGTWQRGSFDRQWINLTEPLHRMKYGDQAHAVGINSGPTYYQCASFSLAYNVGACRSAPCGGLVLMGALRQAWVVRRAFFLFSGIMSVKKKRTMNSISPSHMAWVASGSPTTAVQEDTAGPCSSCGIHITAGVPLKSVETPTTSDHGNIFRYGSSHVCPGCAWLFAAGKGRPGNYIATPTSMEYVVISTTSVVADKRPWTQVLPEIAALPPSTPVAGVLTTDVKPRLFPRVRMATVGAFGLYIHASDHDVSEYRRFDLGACIRLVGNMAAPLAAGYAKASLGYGLLRDHARFAKHPEQGMAWEAQLAPQRSLPHFLPALLVASAKPTTPQTP
jgi:hypothetical protein